MRKEKLILKEESAATTLIPFPNLFAIFSCADREEKAKEKIDKTREHLMSIFMFRIDSGANQ
jgi:hypothetical protein